MYVRGGAQLLIQMPEVECDVVVEAGVYAEVSPASGQPACPASTLHSGETLQ